MAHQVNHIAIRGQDLLAGVPLFRNLSDEDRDRLGGSVIPLTRPKGSVLFLAGDVGAQMYFIQSGRVRITLTSDDGKELLLARLSAGDFFGELALIDEDPRSANAIVEEDCALLQLPRDAFRQFIRNRPEAALQVMQVLSYRLRQTDVLVHDALFFDVSTRLARLLLRLADQIGVDESGRGPVITRAFTHEDLAEQLGTRRESVTRALGEFKRDRLIQTQAVPGSRKHLIRIMDLTGLADQAG